MRIYASFRTYLALSFVLRTASQSLIVPAVSTAASSRWYSIPSGTSTILSNGLNNSSGWLQNSTSDHKGSSLSLSANDLTTVTFASLSTTSIAASSPSTTFPRWSPPEVHSASNGSSDSSTLRVNGAQKDKNVPGITATASYSASGAASSVVPNSITSMKNPFNTTKLLNQTNVCGGPISIASSLITSRIFPANDCLPLNWDQGVLNLPYGGNCSMSPGFDGYNAKSCSCVKSVAKWYHDYATATTTSRQCQSTFNPDEALDIQTIGCSYNTITELVAPYTAPTSCCDKCEVVASAVQLVFWPPADAPSNTSTGANNTSPTNWNVTAAPVQSAPPYGVVDNDFTFISPSVYVIYSSVRASASCVALVNSHIRIGSVHTAVTRAYEPNQLSTAICEAQNMGAGIGYCISPVGEQVKPADCFQGIDNGWRQIDFSELYDPPPASDLLTRYQSCFPTRSISADFASMRFVKPQLAFPPDVTDIDPVWATWGGSTCTPVNLGVYDPPRVLQKATALAPIATPAAAPQVEKVPPSPAAILKSPVATPTTTVTAHDPNTSAKASNQGNNAGTATSTKAPSDPVAIVDPVDSSVNAQNEGSQGAENSNAVKAGSNLNSNSHSNPPNADSKSDPTSDPSFVNTNSNPLTPGTVDTPADTEKQPGVNVVTDPGKHSGSSLGTGNNDPSTAPITLLPQQNADTTKENSGMSETSGKTSVTNENTKGVANGGAIGGTDDGTNNNPDEGTSGGSHGNAIGDEGNSHGMNEGMSRGSNGGTTGTNGVISADTDKGSNGGANDGNPNAVSLASVNNQPVTKDTSGNILLSGSTLAPGRTMIFSSYIIANAPSAVIMDGSTYAPSSTTPPASPLLVDNQLVQMTNGRLEIGSQTLVPGTHTTINNHVIDYANPSQVIEDGVTHSLTPVSSSNPLILDGQTLLRAANGGLITAGTTIPPGSTATVGGHAYSLAGSSSVIMDGGNTYALPATNNAYQIQPVTSFIPPPSPTTLPNPSPLTLANGLVITPENQPSTPNNKNNNNNNNVNYLLPNGASLSPGGPAAIYSGTTYSALPSNAGILAVDAPSGSSPTTTTLAIPSPTPQLEVLPGSQSGLTVAGEVFTSVSGGAAVESGVTGIMTGTGLGGAVVSGFGRQGTGTGAGAGVAVFEGGAGRVGVGRAVFVVVVVGVAMGIAGGSF